MAILKNQTKALVLKSIAFQRKNWCMNCTTLSAPILVALLLFGLQRAINSAIEGDDTQCGCKCIGCIRQDDGTPGNDCPVSASAYEFEWKCTKRDKSTCGFEYSDQSQIFFCAIEDPSRWPPVYAINENDERESAGGGGDATVQREFLYTGENSAYAQSLAARMLPQSTVATAISDPVFAASAEAGAATSQYVYDLSFLSALNIGAPSTEDYYGYLDLPLLSGGADVLVPNCEAFDAELASVANLLPEVVAGGLSILGCSPAAMVEKANAEAIERLMYCTFDKARCDRQEAGISNSFDFQNSAPGKLNVVVYHNDTSKIGGGGGPGNTQRVVKPVDAVINTWLKDWLGEQFSARVIAQSEMPKVGTKLTLDFSSLIGPLFFLWLIQLPLPIALVQLVYEKEKRLRMMMRMHGLSNGVYLAITYVYLYVIYVLYIAVMLIFGSGIGLKFFTLNGPGVQIVFYLLYGNVQVAFAFLLSCVFKNSRTAIVASCLWVFASGLISLFLLDTFFMKERWFTFVLELIPAFGAYRGLWELSQYSFKAAYSNEMAMQFSDINSDGNGMLVVWVIFLIEAPIFMALAWYLEQVLDSGIGIRKHWLFPFQMCSRKVKPDREAQSVGVQMTNRTLNDVPFSEDVSADVLRERAAAYDCAPDGDHPIVVRDLRKTFPAMDGNPKKIAVANMSLKIPKGECFGLLGPNGAGKSTSINMMIGYMEATEGEAYIGGFDVKTGMDDIYTIMGVCPQHDLLWERLTAREHLNFYARLKGLAGSETKGAVDTALSSVDLLSVGNKQVQKFSGGMKRRLSVAISLIGAPAVVYLDEPSTGLDPASRRNLWDVVKAAKQDKAVILTTHSMEEAEVLCDRLGIFVDGRLVCIGNPKELTHRYGGYYLCTVTVPPGQEAGAGQLVRSISAHAKETYSLAGTCKYEIPVADVTLSAVFDRMRDAAAFGVTVLDWGIHNASLEDVFIQLASEASKSSAAPAS